MKTLTFLIYFFATLLFLYTGGKSHAQLDNTFGTGGKVTIPIGTDQDYLSGLLISNNKIILTGYYDNGGNTDFVAVQLSSDGSRDMAFGTSGMASVNVGPNLNVAYATALHTDGKIVVSGYTYNGSNSDFGSIRFSSTGSLDLTFDADGKDSVTFGSSSIDRAFAVKEVDTDKLLIFGFTGDINNSDFALAKLNNDGSYDVSFNSTGKFTYSINDDDNGRCIGIQSDGKIILGGFSGGDFVVIRITSNGTIDNTFGDNGKKVITMGTGTVEEAMAMVVQSDDKIVLAGKSDFSMAAIRLNADGSVDNTFGPDSDGKVVIIQGTASVCNAITVDQNNKLLLAGYTFNGTQSDVFAVRLNSDGTEDVRSIIPVGIGNSVGKAIAVAANNKIVIACTAVEDGTDDDFAVIRLDDMIPTDVVTKEEILAGINLFPNPASYLINVHSIHRIDGIVITDVLGNEVMKMTATGNVQIDIAHLPKGLYNVTISTHKGTVNKKVSVY